MIIKTYQKFYFFFYVPEAYLMHFPYSCWYLKDIVQPKKRGVERGTIWTVLTSYTIADGFLEYLKG
jgi:hypothetical protein